MSHTLLASNITEELYQPNVEKTKQSASTSVKTESFQNDFKIVIIGLALNQKSLLS